MDLSPRSNKKSGAPAPKRSETTIEEEPQLEKSKTMTRGKDKKRETSEAPTEGAKEKGAAKVMSR